MEKKVGWLKRCWLHAKRPPPPRVAYLGLNIPGGAGRRGPRPREGARPRRQRRRLARHARGDGEAVRAEAGHFMKKRNSYFSLNSHAKKTPCNPGEAGEQGARAAGPGAPGPAFEVQQALGAAR